MEHPNYFPLPDDMPSMMVAGTLLDQEPVSDVMMEEEEEEDSSSNEPPRDRLVAESFSPGDVTFTKPSHLEDIQKGNSNDDDALPVDDPVADPNHLRGPVIDMEEEEDDASPQDPVVLPANTPGDNNNNSHTEDNSDDDSSRDEPPLILRPPDKRGAFESIYQGISWMPRKRKWYATISIQNKTVSLGYYTKERQAARAYTNAYAQREKRKQEERQIRRRTTEKEAYKKFVCIGPESIPSDLAPILRTRGSGTSKYQGVSWNQRIRRWHARIKVDGVHLHIGFFSDQVEAARCYALANWKRENGHKGCIHVPASCSLQSDSNTSRLHASTRAGNAESGNCAPERNDRETTMPATAQHKVPASECHDDDELSFQAKVPSQDRKEDEVGNESNCESCDDLGRTEDDLSGDEPPLILRDDNNRRLPHSSIYKGVHWDVSKQKWRAQISLRGTKVSLGAYDQEQEAARAYSTASWQREKRSVASNKTKNPRKPSENTPSSCKEKPTAGPSDGIKASGKPSRSTGLITNGCKSVPINVPLIPAPPPYNGTSKYKGVFRRKSTRSWVAIICVDDKNIHLGEFKDELRAALAYSQAKWKKDNGYGVQCISPQSTCSCGDTRGPENETDGHAKPINETGNHSQSLSATNDVDETSHRNPNRRSHGELEQSDQNASRPCKRLRLAVDSDQETQATPGHPKPLNELTPVEVAEFLKTKGPNYEPFADSIRDNGIAGASLAERFKKLGPEKFEREFLQGLLGVSDGMVCFGISEAFRSLIQDEDGLESSLDS